MKQNIGQGIHVTIDGGIIDSVTPTEAYGEWSETHSYTPLYLTKESDGYNSEYIPISFATQIGENYWYVGVNYSSGDSFGYATGRHCVMGLFKTIEEANKFVKAIENCKKDEYTFDFNGLKYSTSAFVGYFERIENIVVEKLTLTG